MTALALGLGYYEVFLICFIISTKVYTQIISILYRALSPYVCVCVCVCKCVCVCVTDALKSHESGLPYLSQLGYQGNCYQRSGIKGHNKVVCGGTVIVSPLGDSRQLN